MPVRDPLTLCIDCGGGGIKAVVLRSDGLPANRDEAPIEDNAEAPSSGGSAGSIRTPTPYPLPPELLVQIFVDLAARLPRADRVTVGMPGMIREGQVIATPHYVTKTGPRSKVLPELVDRWAGYDMKAAVQQALGIPALVLNDAEVAGSSLVVGRGLEMMLTLGTGLGNAIFHNGNLAPHAELSQGNVRWGLTFDDYLGEHERLRLGDAHWSRRVRRVLEGFQPVYQWDTLYLGGGNSRRITRYHRTRMPAGVQVVSNEAGMLGGVRAWSLVATPPAKQGSGDD